MEKGEEKLREKEKKRKQAENIRKGQGYIEIYYLLETLKITARRC